METKIINTTHIDTGGHGYYSVSKKDITLLGIADKITNYSGQTIDRVYLEEDQDGMLLYDTAKLLGYEIKCKDGYNLNFKVTHNYCFDLFAWKPQIGQVVKVSGAGYTITEIFKNRLMVISSTGRRYKIPLSNPFKYIDKVLSNESTI